MSLPPWFYENCSYEYEILGIQQQIRALEGNNPYDELLKEIECPVCFEHMRPPIYVCVAGHSICNSCNSKVSFCPMCRATIQSARNVTLEKISEKLKHFCKNRTNGCEYRAVLQTLICHEKTCEYTQFLFNCPTWTWHHLPAGQKCDWKGADVMTHIRQRHVNVNQNNTISCSRDINEKMPNCNIWKEFDNIFRCIHFYRSNTFNCVVEFVQTNENERDSFIYTVNFSGKNPDHKINFTLPCLRFVPDGTYKLPEETPLLTIPMQVLRLIGINEINFKIELKRGS